MKPALVLVSLLFLLGGAVFGCSVFLCQYFGDVAFKIQAESQDATVDLGELCKGNDCAPAWLLQGYISDTSMKKLRHTLKLRNGVSWLCLASPGGEPGAARDLAKMLRDLNVRTCVVPRRPAQGSTVASICASACTHIWLGAKSRVLASGNAYIGFHSTRAGDGACCVLPNAIKRWSSRLIYWHDGIGLGDQDARSALFAEGSGCGPNDLYRLLPDEALRRHLVTVDHVGAWFWRAGDKPVNTGAFTEAPDSKPCGKQVS